MMAKEFFKHTLTIQRRKRVQATPPGIGWTTVPDGDELVDISIEIDIDALARDLGTKAWRSRGGRSVLGGGMIKAFATEARPKRKVEA